MKRSYVLFTLLVFFVLPEFSSYAQYDVTGRVADASTGEGISGANILLVGSDAGTVTGLNGDFSITIPEMEELILVTSIGYLDTVIAFSAIDISDTIITAGTIFLARASIGLAEVNIIASRARERVTPVAASTIQSGMIERQLGDRPYPEIMKMVPGVYASKQGGGSGDASMNIRGFQQENIELLLNGVPISSVENGLVYWNNWLGLTDATQQIQVQRGLGASLVAQNSVGGTVNIITKTTNIEKGGSLRYEMTDYGNLKSTLMLSTGRMKNDLAITFQGSYFSGPGYADATYVKGFAYFLSVSKEFNKDHMLVFTALGNPEKHGQRNFRLSKEEVDMHGLKYNKDWGSYNGRINNASENFYHKPLLSLNHYWRISDKDFLATSLYLSFGHGGGKWTETFGNNPWIFSYYNPSGQIDWPAIYELNSMNPDTFRLANGTDTTGYSINIQTDYLASHVWTGLLANYQHQFSDRVKLTAGLHGRYFKSVLQQKVRDLLGGRFFIDDYQWAIDGVAGREQVKHVGDIVKVDNGAVIDFINLFGQIEYTSGRISAFAAASGSGNFYRREDRYNYISDIKSDRVSLAGYDLKGGININLNEFNNVYFNAGFFSRAPYFKYVFGNYTNTPTQDLKNEKVKSAEIGYGLNLSGTQVRISAYMTSWEDKSILTNEYNQFEDPAMLQGQDARHLGIEGEIRQTLTPWAIVGGIFSFGNWKWANNVTGYLFNDDNVVVDTINVYSDGLFVGDAPMTQIGLYGQLKILRLFDLNVNWIYYDRMYADFNPALRTDPDDHEQPFRLPSYHWLEAHLGYSFTIAGLDSYVNISCFNILNDKHIIRGEDGQTHDLKSFTGFWDFGRTFNFSVKIYF